MMWCRQGSARFRPIAENRRIARLPRDFAITYFIARGTWLSRSGELSDKNHQRQEIGADRRSVYVSEGGGLAEAGEELGWGLVRSDSCGAYLT